MHIEVGAHNIKQAQVEHRQEQVRSRRGLAKHKLAHFGLEQVGHKQGLKLEVVKRRREFVERK